MNSARPRCAAAPNQIDPKTMPKQKPRGRPAKFTPQIQEKILTVLTVGAYRSDACHYVGIQYETLRFARIGWSG